MTNTKDEALKLALDWYDSGHEDREEFQAMIENLLASPVQEPVAVYDAVSAIYFADDSDYLPALWSVVRSLAPDLALLLESNPSAAWHQAEKLKDSALATPPAAQPAPTSGAKMPCGASVTNVYDAYEAGKKAAQPAVPLTDEQIIDIRRKTTAKTHGEWADTKAFARAIEAAHGITKGQP
jgi:hypothetical protein